MKHAMLCLLLLLAPVASTAQDSLPPAPMANQQLDDPALEKQARGLMESIRCLTCQGQSVIDSDAPMASDMRHQIRTRIAAGESADSIRDWLIERYGEYISYEPRISSATWPLFAIPLALMGLALIVLWRRLRPKAESES